MFPTLLSSLSFSMPPAAKVYLIDSVVLNLICSSDLNFTKLNILGFHVT